MEVFATEESETKDAGWEIPKTRTTVSVADHVSPQNSQYIQSQEGGGPRIDAGEDVTRINIDNEEMAWGFGDTGCRNEYDVRTITFIF